MSISLAINNALSGLAASQQGLAVISQNVSNANTEGYSKKVANQSTVIVAGVGNGVRIDEVTRLADAFLTNESRVATSANAAIVRISASYGATPKSSDASNLPAPTAPMMPITTPAATTVRLPFRPMAGAMGAAP